MRTGIVFLLLALCTLNIIQVVSNQKHVTIAFETGALAGYLVSQKVDDGEIVCNGNISDCIVANAREILDKSKGGYDQQHIPAEAKRIRGTGKAINKVAE